VFNGDSDGLGIIWYIGLIGIFTRNVNERKWGDPLKEVIHSAGDHTGPPPMRALVANMARLTAYLGSLLRLGMI
jgi:hypothetical protein